MKRTLLLLALLVAAASPAFGQDRTGTVEITPVGGAYFGGRLDAGSNGLFNHDVEVKDAGTYGVRLGYNFNRRFGLEWGWTRAKADIQNVGSSVLWVAGTKLGELTVNQYDMNFVISMAHGRVIPYFTIGGGATTFQASLPGSTSSTDTRFTANAGFGLKMFLDPKVALRFEGRGRSSYVSDSGCNSSWDSSCHDSHGNSDSRWYTSGEVTGGLTVAF